ncbi:MAG: hypothetical protein IT560_09725 [Alphaproteobacteria bacterium]|nr:hypothetical protein [Alphaproteobacteria bacterium]
MKEEFNNSSADPANSAAATAARDDARIEAIKARIAGVPEGDSVVTFLNQNNVTIELLDDPVNWAASTLTITTVRDGEYFYQNPKILLKRGLTDDNLLQAIVHETGHLNQHLSKVGNPDRILSEKEYILFYRAAEADAQALCTEVTWALKQQGDAGPWNAAWRATRISATRTRRWRPLIRPASTTARPSASPSTHGSATPRALPDITRRRRTT